ncbi:MAG: nitroreductase family protein [Rikenellaceae bacterium]
MIKEIKEHKSVRNFSTKQVEKQKLEEILSAATRASTVGNMQLYSIIVSQDKEILESLAPCHFSQPMLKDAPVIMTFCADVSRFSLWCKMRDAEPGYDNFLWFVNSVIDTTLASENAALEAQAQGLGICYLGTTLYTAEKISEILNLPQGVIPVTTLAMGYPKEDIEHPMTDRLPLKGVVHYEKYSAYTNEGLEEIWRDRETSEQTKQLLEENKLDNLAKIFTDRRYTKKDSLHFSKVYFDFLTKQGFFNI